MSVYEDAGSDPEDSVCELWSLRPDVLVTTRPDGALSLLSRWGETLIRSAGPRLRDLLGRMQLGPTRLENVLDAGRLSAHEAAVERAKLLFALESMQQLVVRSLATAEGSQVLLSVEPISRHARFRPRVWDQDRPIRLSSFAMLRMQDAMMQAESPLALHRVILHKPEAAMIASALAQQRFPADLCALVDTPAPLVRAVASYLCAAGVALVGTPAESGFDYDEDRDPVLRMWSGLDLLFHSRSTLGRHDGDFGATYPLGRGRCPEPAVKPWAGESRIPLYRPRIEEILKTDPPFTAVLEARRSGRSFGSRPPTVRELGELLYRALRIRNLIHGGDGPADASLLDRPYPAGGAVHELEFYVTVHACDGLDPGVYAYDALHHALVPISSSEEAGRILQSQAQIAADLDAPPPVLISITARFGRVLWKYSGMGYSLIMKDAGVVLMGLQLVATALRLAACPVGAVEIDQSSTMLGLDWRVESGVAALVLGRAADPDPAPGPQASIFRHPVNDAQWAEIGAKHVHGG